MTNTATTLQTLSRYAICAGVDYVAHKGKVKYIYYSLQVLIKHSTKSAEVKKNK
jgi:hypothetical protein